MTKQNLRIRVALAAALLEPCLLCAGKATVAAMFAPKDELRRQLDWPKGRRVFYSLCECCAGSEPATEVAERAGRTIVSRLGLPQ